MVGGPDAADRERRLCAAMLNEISRLRPWKRPRPTHIRSQTRQCRIPILWSWLGRVVRCSRASLGPAFSIWATPGVSLRPDFSCASRALL